MYNSCITTYQSKQKEAMAIFTFVTHGRVRNDGTQTIKLRIAHGGKSSYISTDISVEPCQFKNGAVVKRADREWLNSRLEKFLHKYIIAYDKIENPAILTVNELLDVMMRRSIERHTFIQVADEYFNALGEERVTTANCYRRACSSFIEFCGEDPHLETLTHTKIVEYANWLRTRPRRSGRSKMRPEDARVPNKWYRKKPTAALSPTTQNIYITAVRVIVNYAIKVGYVKYDIDPFVSVNIPVSSIRYTDLTLEEVAAIRDVELKKDGAKIARDVFMLSYYLCGINLADMLKIDFRAIDQVDFVRQKTVNRGKHPQHTIFKVCKEAFIIVSRYINIQTGMLEFGRFDTKEKLFSLMNRHMDKIATAAGIRRKVTFYSARKSFAQHAFDLGESKEVVDYCLGHTINGSDSFFSYVRVMSRHADVCIDKVTSALAAAGKDKKEEIPSECLVLSK